VTGQTGSARGGAACGTRRVVRSGGHFGNDSTAGLPASRTVTLTLRGGTGPLLGTTNLDIGTGAGDGVVSWSDLEIDSAGTNKQLSATASGFTNGLSSFFSVSPAAASRLTIQDRKSVV